MTSHAYMMEQAGCTAHEYMLFAQKSLDGIFGKGYAKNNPVATAGFMNTCAMDFHTSIMNEKFNALNNQLECIALSIEKSSSSSLDNVADCISEVADAIRDTFNADATGIQGKTLKADKSPAVKQSK